MRGPLVFCLSRERNRLSAEMGLKGITIETKSLSDPFCDQTNRYDENQIFKVRAWSTEQNNPEGSDPELVMIEFPNPTGEATYFAPSTLAAAVSDDLIYDRLNREADNR